MHKKVLNKDAAEQYNPINRREENRWQILMDVSTNFSKMKHNILI